MQADVITITAFISLFRAGRNRVRQLVKEAEFIETYCKAELNVCEQRDVKGLYAKARRGEIADLTGYISL